MTIPSSLFGILVLEGILVGVLAGMIVALKKVAVSHWMIDDNNGRIVLASQSPVLFLAEFFGEGVRRGVTYGIVGAFFGMAIYPIVL